jgi:hydrogenase maturation protein HypF
VWRIAHELGVLGSVQNDGNGVLITAQSSTDTLEQFLERLQNEPPPLAQIASIEREAVALEDCNDFKILHSSSSQIHTHIAPDAATCAACVDELFDSASRRFHYPFTNCTHCGPRLSIVTGIPYDRVQTTMQAFDLCAECAAEYHSPSDRRFHAQPNACAICGPEIWLEAANERISGYAALQACAERLKAGEIVAIKGLGGVHLAVDARNVVALLKLRERKHRPAKPLALMAKNLEQIEQFCEVNELEKRSLQSAAAPIVLLERKADCPLSQVIAPNQNLIGFMLPYTPLHHVLMQLLEQPIVLTSGNRSGNPQCIQNEQSLVELEDIADAQLLHNRDIANRVDDSVLRFMAGEMRVLRRARGFAPAPLKLPQGFESAPNVLAFGGELKNTFCLLNQGQAILSQHNGDVANYATLQDFQQHLALYQALYQYQSDAVVVDRHPHYQISQYGREWAAERGLPVIEVQHHHAHIAACLAENGYALDAEPVLGMVLDGTGYGLDHTLWGGEFLKANYAGFERLAYLKPVPLLGRTEAILQPWRMAFAHLYATGNWPQIERDYAELSTIKAMPRAALKTFVAMMEHGLNCPLTSSMGRLFDAVAALLGICYKQPVTYEGQAAIELEALVDTNLLSEIEGYPFAFAHYQLDPSPLWQALLDDLLAGQSRTYIATRFHKGLAQSLVKVASQLAQEQQLNTIVLSGGVFQNRTLLEAVQRGLAAHFQVIMHKTVPANDGGLALGQAAIAAAQLVGAK